MLRVNTCKTNVLRNVKYFLQLNIFDMQIILTPSESEQYFKDALCNGIGMIGSYGLVLTYDNPAYTLAKSKLDNPCREDVWFQILVDGNMLALEDTEDNGQLYTITLADVHERVQKMPQAHLIDLIDGDDDACTADVLLQTVFLKEVIYG